MLVPLVDEELKITKELASPAVNEGGRNSHFECPPATQRSYAGSLNTDRGLSKN
jgi:hypothetical protein